MTWIKKYFGLLLANKKVAAVFAASTVVMVSYQNCAKINFDQVTPASVQSVDGTCLEGMYLNPADQMCLPEFLNINVIAFKKASDAAWTSQSPSNLLEVKPDYQYRINVAASPNLEVLGVESGLDVVDIGMPIRTGVCSGRSNSQWNPMEPWGMDGPCANPATCSSAVLGNNDWNYNRAAADLMGGCAWAAEISARRIGDSSVFRKKAKLNLDALLCEPASVVADPLCPSGNKVCKADGRSYECVPVVTTTTLPPTTTTLPPTTTTTLPSTTTTTTLPPTTTTTRPPPVDVACANTTNATVFLPYVPLVTPSIPASCSNGIELNNLIGGIYELKVNTTTPARESWIDFATYTVPDSIHISAVNAAGVKTKIFAQCRIQTATYGFFEVERPPSDSIRQYKLTIPAGTTKLYMDFSETTSPFYIRMQGLCDFNRNSVTVLKANTGGRAGQVRRYPEGSTILNIPGVTGPGDGDGKK